MDYKEKYEWSLERAKKLHKDAITLQLEQDIKDYEYIFPELRESEDEKIRKEIIDYINRLTVTPNNIDRYNSWIAWLEKQGDTNETTNSAKFAQGVLRGAAINLITWIDYNAAEGNTCLSNVQCKDIENALVRGDWDKIYGYIKKKLEKQGEQKPVISNDVLKEGVAHFGITQYQIDNWLKKYVDVEKKGEQKPVVKVEPKFHEGDWLCVNKPNDYARLVKIIKVVDVFGKERYKVSRDYDSDLDVVECDFIEKEYHLWTIGDAKDGDVLYSLDSNRPFIYKVRNDYEQAVAYCGLNINGKFFVWNTKDCVITLSNYVPATKEQRNLLFQKMHEAGWEWDVDKKELKKIEKQAPQEQDEFEAELNALLKKYEHLPKHELADSLLSSTFEL